MEKRSEKLKNLIRLRDLSGRLTLLELLFTRIHDQKLRSFVFCFKNSENFSISEQILILNNIFGTYKHFKVIFTVSMKGSQSRKASVEVSKLIFVFSHNSHRVLEWSIVNSKTNFVAWKSYVLIVFRKEYYLAIFFSFWAPKGLSQSG